MPTEQDETSGAEWRVCAKPPRLGDGDVHVWRIPLAAPATALAELESLLQPAERDRAARFRFERFRNRFTVGRASLRILLGQYLGLPPRHLEFVFGPHGKPELANPGVRPPLHFNLSHSQDLALLAVSTVGPIGVDVEHLRPVPEARQLVTRFFSSREDREFSRLPEQEQPRAFFSLWTRKEALLKAIGEGIAHSLKLVEVTFRPEEPVRFLALPGGRVPEEWSLKHLEPGDGFVGALVVHGQPRRIETYAWASALPTGGDYP